MDHNDPETLAKTLKHLSDAINELPPRLRDYVHLIETHCDPSGTVREVIALRENQQALVDKIDRQTVQMTLKNEMIADLKQALKGAGL